MQFEMNHKVGTDYSTVRFTAGIDTTRFKLPVIESFENSFSRLGGVFLPEEGYVWRFPSFITSEVIAEVIRNTCFVCGGLMKDSTAYQNEDVIENPNGLSMTSHVFKGAGKARQIKVRKCIACGHSHT